MAYACILPYHLHVGLHVCRLLRLYLSGSRDYTIMATDITTVSIEAITFTKMYGVFLLGNKCCQRETTNIADSFAVTVVKDRTVVGHPPRKISNVCSIYLRKGGIDNRIGDALLNCHRKDWKVHVS